MHNTKAGGLAPTQDKGIGQEQALYYMAYATFLEMRGAHGRARDVYKDGLSKYAQTPVCLRNVQQHNRRCCGIASCCPVLHMLWCFMAQDAYKDGLYECVHTPANRCRHLLIAPHSPVQPALRISAF